MIVFPQEMHGPTCRFWANLTPFSLQCPMAGCAGKCFDTTRHGVPRTVSVPTFAEQIHVDEDDSAFDKLLVGDLIRSLFFLQERDLRICSAS